MHDKVDQLRDTRASAAGAIDKIAAARVWLFKEKPFFGVLARALAIVPSAEVPAFRLYADDRLLVNPLSVLRTPFPALCARLAHLALHAALGGFVRRGDRDPWRWNLAHDLAIDPLVRGAGLSLGLPPPPDEVAPGAHAEQIFALLPEGARPGAAWCDISDAPLSDPPPPPPAPPGPGTGDASESDAEGASPSPIDAPSRMDQQARALTWKMRLA